MTQPALTSTGEAVPLPEGLQGIVADWSSDQRAFKKVPWGKAMMWIFLVSDTFIFSAVFDLVHERANVHHGCLGPTPARSSR